MGCIQPFLSKVKQIYDIDMLAKDRAYQNLPNKSNSNKIISNSKMSSNSNKNDQ